MAENLNKRIIVRRRYGNSFLPLIMFNGIIIFSLIFRIEKFGLVSVPSLGLGAFIAVLFINIIPLYAVYDIWSYCINFSEDSLYVRPLFNFGPYIEMKFDDIDVVDLKTLSDLGKFATKNLNPSVIVLYRKGWDGEEVFALDPRRTNLKQFKELIQRIYEQRPNALTENALRYLRSSSLITPPANAEGEFLW